MHRRAILSCPLSILLFLPILTGCSEASGDASADSESITPSELMNRLGTADAPIVLDVRTPVEYRMGHVPGAYNLEDREVPARIDDLKQLAEREIVVYCEVGPRARWVESYLRQNGFINVRHLVGDYSGWRQVGNPVE
jgi:phage shock protein E